MNIRTVAALFVMRDSIYKTLPGVDSWDIDRDARKWPGGAPTVCRPPCRAWGRMHKFAKPRDDEKELATFSVDCVRTYGGVLEHPADSKLWVTAGLPLPDSAPDAWGGYTLRIDQFHFGHKALKPTWLYVVGCEPARLPPIPVREGTPTHCIRPAKTGSKLLIVSHVARERTPPALAEWLVETARRSLR